MCPCDLTRGIRCAAHGGHATTAPADRRYLYFVSYAHGQGFGAADVFYDRPVTTFQDVQVLTQKVYEQIRARPCCDPISIDDIVVLNYQLLSGPSDSDGARLATAERALTEIKSMVGQFDTPRDAGRVRAFVGDVGQVAAQGLGEAGRG